MQDDIQKAVLEKMKNVSPENVFAETDVIGFKQDFLNAHGFDVEGIDYDAEINIQNISG
jgi:enoyl-[acyl-carrier protein] reductase/trans-2-enoyl-CoA reductase (NAD+)